MSSVQPLLEPPAGAARRRPRPESGPGDLRATRASVTLPTRRRSMRSSRSCARPGTLGTDRLIALIVVLWRAGLRIQEAFR